MKKILITGRQGQVGWELQKSLSNLGCVVSLSRSDCNLADLGALKKVIAEINPSIIINAAAYTAVDQAETDRETAELVNAKVPAFLAEEAKKRRALFVHYSTDYVFDGTSANPYQEDHPSNPINVYGETKRRGELYIQQVGGSSLILRTSWVYALRGKNFLLTILRLAKEKEQLSIINDQIGAPTWAYTIADGTSKIVHHCLKNPEFSRWGIYHLTSSGQTTWHGFAEAIVSKTLKNNPQGEFKLKNLKAIPTSEYPTPAQRPKFSALNLEKIEKEFGLVMPHWETALDLCLSDYRG